jgi:hypothetical protein
MEFLELLAQEIERTGHIVNRNGSSLLVEPIHLKIECDIGERIEHNVNEQYKVLFSISIKATHEHLFPDGIWDCLAGFGGSDQEAFTYAAQVWTDCVFPPIHEILVPIETADMEVQRLDLVSRNEASGEVFAWKMHLGALHAMGEFWDQRDNLETEILFKKMHDAIVVELSERRLIWIKAYICIMPDGSIRGDCWLNNKDWLEGLNALFWFAEEWKAVDTYTALKQFMVIKPCEWSEIKDAEKLRQSLPRQKKPKFLSRWFRR